MKKTKLCLSLLALLATSNAWSHGYMSEPASRGYSCTAAMGNLNTQCGAVQYEPQSVEGHDGFPAYQVQGSGGGIVHAPKDGEIAGAGLASMSPLNAQSDSRWYKQSMKAGKQIFTWTFTAPHRTKDWRYYMTKPDWNPNKPLTRASFDTKPFCVIDGKNQIPPLGKSQPHECNVPERDGYQVILATWDVGDTDATFYNVIDVDFGGHNHPGDDVGNDNDIPSNPDGDNDDAVIPPNPDDDNGTELPAPGEYPGWKQGYQYKGGEIVRGRDGKLYQCKSSNGANGWCGLNHAYEPGNGWAWSEAWTLR